MSVIVFTGQPGSGKTAAVVDMLAHDEQFKGRPLFVTGIPDLAIDHSPCPPVSEWTEQRVSPDDESIQLSYFTFPENAVVVIDEAQRIYRPRPVGSKVPPEVAAFETHRHTGVDFILITQHAGLIDSNIRKLVGRHVHIRVTPFGRYRYEWTELGDPESSSSREVAAKEKYSLPKRAFVLYKSSQRHTKIKVKMPWYVYLFGACLVGTIALSVYAYKRVSAKVEPGNPEAKVTQSGSPSKATEPNSSPATAEDILALETPLLKGRADTAPMYAELRQPKQLPMVVGCIKTPTRCECQNQQGTDAGLDRLQCENWLANPPFNPYLEVKTRTETSAQRGAVDRAQPERVQPLPETPARPLSPQSAQTGV